MTTLNTKLIKLLAGDDIKAVQRIVISLGHLSFKESSPAHLNNALDLIFSLCRSKVGEILHVLSVDSFLFFVFQHFLEDAFSCLVFYYFSSALMRFFWKRKDWWKSFKYLSWIFSFAFLFLFAFLNSLFSLKCGENLASSTISAENKHHTSWRLLHKYKILNALFF